MKKKTVLETYAEFKAKKEEIEDALANLQPEVMAYLEKEGVDTLREEYGTFSIVYRKQWIYSKELQEKEKQYNAIVKTAKQDEQDNGEAKAEESKSLSYRAYEAKE